MPAMRLPDNLTGLISKIEDEYGIKVKSILQSDEGYLISTGERVLNAIKVEDSETHLIYVSGIYEYVKSRGFSNTVSVYTTKGGKYYIPFGDEFYMLIDYLGDYNCSFRDDGESIIKLLAAFHKASEGYKPPLGGKAKSYWGRWIEEYRKEMKSLRNYRDSIKLKDCKTKFEELFLDSCDLYMNRMAKSINILKCKGYLNRVEESMKRRQVCIESFRQSNFYKVKSEIYLECLNKCVYDIWEKDIADFMQKMVEYNMEKGVTKLGGYINLYNAENPLLENSTEIVKAFLLFPKEYLKVCSKHYRGKDKWCEDRYLSRLKSAILIEDKKAELSEILD